MNSLNFEWRDSLVYEWQRAGDERDEERLTELASVFVDAYEEAYNEATKELLESNKAVLDKKATEAAWEAVRKEEAALAE